LKKIKNEKMNIGFLGLGKLGLPCALAIEKRGHTVFGFDINQNVKDILVNKKLPYREEGAEELLVDNNIIWSSISDVVKKSDIIFVPIQTPHLPKYEGDTRIPEERVDFDYTWLKQGMKNLSDEIEKQGNDKIVVIISTVLPGTIRREIKPFLSNHVKLCYNPFFIAMGTTIRDFVTPEFVLFGVDDDNAYESVKQFYSTIHDRPVYKCTIEEAEMIKVTYNTYITMKVCLANTVMELSHKLNNIDCDVVMKGLFLANERLMSPKYLLGGMGDGGGCVKPTFKVKVNNDIVQIDELYNSFDDESTYLVDSCNYTCNTKNQKKINEVTRRHYIGDMINFTTESGKKISLTTDHIVPVERNGKLILVKAIEIRNDDKFYVL
jgi:UDPglucose 6-dehydrogenase